MNPTIRPHLDPEEYAPIERLANRPHVTPEAIANAGLDCIMQRTRESGNPKEIVDLHLGWHNLGDGRPGMEHGAGRAVTAGGRPALRQVIADAEFLLI